MNRDDMLELCAGTPFFALRITPQPR